VKHSIATLVIFLGAALCASAGDDVKTKKPTEPEKKADADKGAQDEVKEADKTKEILARLAKNMQASEELLGKKDPGDVTRQIQRDIVKDLDALIEQSKNQQNQSGGGGAPQSSPKQQGGSPKPQNNQNPDQQPKPKDQQQEQGGECKKGECKNAGGEKPGEAKDGGQGMGSASGQAPNPQGPARQQAGKAKDGGQKEERPMPASLGQKSGQEGKEGKNGQAKGQGQKDPKDGNDGQVARAKDHNPAIRNDLSDLFRNGIWGHYPDMRRQEMDAYQRERFLQRYEDLLRQYYRTLSEQNRKRDD